MQLPFYQVDVFSTQAFKGNPLAVVVGADGLSDAQMASIANWTNLSETSFLLAPKSPQADYRVRIFTPNDELPFAGHPTLGSAHVWRSFSGGRDKPVIVQECAAGLVTLRNTEQGLAFAAPALRRTGPVSDHDLTMAITALRLGREDIVEAQWADNGPGWLALRLRNSAAVLAIEPDWAALVGQKLGVVGFCPQNPGMNDPFYEVRAFVGEEPGYEDPVTGSLNASLAQWLIGSGLAPDRYTASQGTAMGRAGRISIERAGEDIWVGGEVVTRISGVIDI